jgi:ketosteroid isomerase-like protein
MTLPIPRAIPINPIPARPRDARTLGMITLTESAAAAAREISMNRNTVAVLLLLLFAASSFAKKEKSANGENLLLQLEANFAADVAKHGHDAFLTYFAEDGVEIVDGGGINDKDAMRKQPPWPEGTTLTWTPVHAEMAASGDLGYTYGNYVYTAKNKEGKLVANYGKYTSIWKKQKDGQWKVVVDMGNSSPDPKTGK